MKRPKIQIKVCGMKYEKNIQDISLVRPNFIGLIFYPLSPRFVGNFFSPPPKIKNIKTVGVFVDADEQEICRQIQTCNLDYIQLHGNESPDFVKNFFQRGIKIIKTFHIDENFLFQNVKNYIESSSYFLFDTKSKEYGGSGKQFCWNKLLEYPFDIPFFLSGGIQLADSTRILSISHPNFFGVDLNSGFEKSPSIKDLSKIKKFIDKIRL